MPYITDIEKDEIDKQINYNDLYMPTSGALCYVIYKIVLAYLKLNGKSFRTFSEINGALECAKMEFYRKIVAPYEELKIKENGDVH